MTIPATTRRAGPFVGNGISAVFPFTFRVFDDSDIQVRTSFAGVETSLTLGVHYTVAINVDQDAAPGGEVTMLVPPATDVLLVVVGNLPYDQTLDLPSGGNFAPLAIENALDRGSIQIQQLAERQDRTLTLPATASGASTTLPAPLSNALIGWNGAATGLANISPGTLATLVAYGANTAEVFVGDGNQVDFPLQGNAVNVGNLDVAINGVVKVPGNDYSLIDDGMTVRFTVAPPNTHVVLIRYAQALPEVPSGSGTGALVVADVAALRNEAKAAGKAVTTRSYNTAVPQWGGGGTYLCDLGDVSSTDNGGTVIVGTDGGRWKLIVEGNCLPARQCGVRGDGTTPSTDLLLAADEMARGLRKSLLIEGIVLVDKQIWLTAPTHWVFAGHPNHGNTNLGPTGSTVPGSWLKVPASMPSGTSALVVEHPGIVFTHGALGCETMHAWPYDGLTILANGFRWDKGLVFSMGRDGVVLGTPTGTAAEYNSNSVVLDQITTVWNGRHGINVGDDHGSEDANTFLFLSPRSFNNAGHGIRFGRTYLGGTVVAPTVEFNAVGLYFENAARGILILGGDIEANVGPHVAGVEGTGPLQNVIEVTPGQNHFQYVTIQGVVRNDSSGSGASPLTTKGDLFTFSTVNARLPVGTNGQVLVADSSTGTGLKWSTNTLTNPAQVKQDFVGAALVDIENLSASSGASAQLHVQTNRGTGGLWQRATVDGGEFIFGTFDHPGNIGLMSNGVVRFGFPSDGSLAIGGYSAVGTAGQVLTSGGPGAPVSWTSAGGVSSVGMTVPLGLTVSGSPITASGTFGVAWAGGYQGYTTAEAAKLSGLPTAAVNKAGDTMTGALTVPTSITNTGTYPTIIADGSTGASVSVLAGTVAAGMRTDASYVEMGTISGHDLIILTNNGQRIRVTAAGQIQLHGLPTSSPGVSGAIWRDGSNYVRIDP